MLNHHPIKRISISGRAFCFFAFNTMAIFDWQSEPFFNNLQNFQFQLLVMFAAFNASPTNDDPIPQDINDIFIKAANNKDIEALEDLLSSSLDNTDLLFSIYKLLGELHTGKEAISYCLNALDLRDLQSIYATMMLKAIESNCPSIANFCLSKLPYPDIKSKYLTQIQSLHSLGDYSHSDSPISVSSLSITLDPNIQKSFKRLYDVSKQYSLDTPVQIDFKYIETISIDNDSKSEVVSTSTTEVRSSKRLKTMDLPNSPESETPFIHNLCLFLNLNPDLIFNNTQLNTHIDALIINYKQFHKRQLSPKSDFYNWCILFDDSSASTNLTIDQMNSIASTSTLSTMLNAFIVVGISIDAYALVLPLFPFLDAHTPFLLSFVLESIYKMHSFIQHEHVSTIHPYFHQLYYISCDLVFQGISKSVDNNENNNPYTSVYPHILYNHFTNNINAQYILDYGVTPNLIEFSISPITHSTIDHLTEIEELDARPSILRYCQSLLQLNPNESGYYYHLQFNSVILYLLHFHHKLSNQDKQWIFIYLITILSTHPHHIIDLQMTAVFKQFVLVLIRMDLQLLFPLHVYLEQHSLCMLLESVYIGINGLLKMNFTCFEQMQLLTCYYGMGLFNNVPSHNTSTRGNKISNYDPFILFLTTITLDLSTECPISLINDTSKYLRQYLKRTKNTYCTSILDTIEYYTRLQTIFNKEFDVYRHPSQNSLMECQFMDGILNEIILNMPINTHHTRIYKQLVECRIQCTVAQILNLLMVDGPTLLFNVPKIVELRTVLDKNRTKSITIHETLLLLQLAPFCHLEPFAKIPTLIDDQLLVQPLNNNMLLLHKSDDPVVQFIQGSKLLKLEFKIEILEYLNQIMDLPLDYKIQRIYYHGKYATDANDTDMLRLLSKLYPNAMHSGESIYTHCNTLIDTLLLEDDDNWQYRAHYFKSKLLLKNGQTNDALQMMTNRFNMSKNKIIVTYMTPDEINGKYYYYNATINDYKGFLEYLVQNRDNTGDDEMVIDTENSIVPTITDDKIINTSRLVYYIIVMMKQLPRGQKRSVNEILKSRASTPMNNELQIYQGNIISDDRLWVYIKYSKELLEEELGMSSASVKTLEYMIQVIYRIKGHVNYDELVMICKQHLKQFLK